MIMQVKCNDVYNSDRYRIEVTWWLRSLNAPYMIRAINNPAIESIVECITNDTVTLFNAYYYRERVRYEVGRCVEDLINGILSGTYLGVRIGMRGREGFLHLLTKMIVIRHFIKEEGVDPSDVFIDESIHTHLRFMPFRRSDHDKYPDVYIRSRGLAIEVENIYPYTSTPWSKIAKTKAMYRNLTVSNHGLIKGIWFVVPNFQAQQYTNKLKEYEDYLTKIYTADFITCKLKPLYDSYTPLQITSLTIA